MNRAVRARLRLLVSIVLFSAVALAHASTNKVDKKTNREHPSRFSKVAFWRHHRDGDKTGGKLAKAHQNKQMEHHSRISEVAFWRHHKDSQNMKTARANHVPEKNAQAKAAQTKPAPRTMAAGNKSRTPAKTTSTANKPKPQPTATASLQH